MSEVLRGTDCVCDPTSRAWVRVIIALRSAILPQCPPFFRNLFSSASCPILVWRTLRSGASGLRVMPVKNDFVFMRMSALPTGRQFSRPSYYSGKQFNLILGWLHDEDVYLLSGLAIAVGGLSNMADKNLVDYMNVPKWSR